MINFGIQADLANDSLRHNVFSMDLKVFKVKEGLTELNRHSFHQYDQNQNRILLNRYNQNGQLTSVQKSFVNEIGVKIGFKNFDEIGNLRSECHFELDSRSRRIAKYLRGERDEEYKYDEMNNIIEVFHPEIRSRLSYEYDDSGCAIMMTRIKEQSSQFGFSIGDPGITVTYYDNDRFGNIVYERTINPDTERVLFETKSLINEMGDEIEMISTMQGVIVHAHRKYEYQYDSKGNWINKKTHNVNGQFIEESVRQIEYFNS